MAQAGYTPISLYYSTTSTQEPTAGNLVSGELAINIADGKLFYKNSAGNVRLLSIGYGSSSVTPTNGGVQYGTGTALALTAAGSSGQILRSNGAAAPTWADLSTLGVNTISFGTTGLTPNSATAGAVTVAGTLVTANGGTGLGGATPFTANGVLYASSASALTSGSALTFDGTTLKSQYFNVQDFAASNDFVLAFKTNAGTQVGYVGVVSSANNLSLTSTNSLIFSPSNTEQARLTSTGLGIGTSSPAYKLDVAGADLRLNTPSGTAAFRLARAGTNKWAIYNDTSENLHFYSDAAGLDRAILDSSGNLGLGVTPSAWISSGRAIDILAFGSVAQTSSGSLASTFNAYQNSAGNWIYKTTNPAAQYQCGLAGLGQHAWFTAPSGTAGNAITFTQAMTLDASGNLGIGATSPARTLDVRATSPFIRIQETGSGGDKRLEFSVDSVGVATISAPQSAQVLTFNTVGSERARITSGGDLLVGTTVQTLGTARLSVDSSGLTVVSRSTTSTESPYASFNSATSGNNQFMWFYTGDAGQTFRGSIEFNRGAGLVAYNTTSDYRAKDIIGPITNSGEVIDSLKVYEGVMKGATQSRPMLIAHEAQAHAPYAVSGVKDEVNDDGTPKFQQMDVSSLVPLLLAEIQSLRQRVALLEGN